MRRPHLDLKTRALDYYLQHHLQGSMDAPKVSRSLADCVSDWKTSCKISPMVDLALKSVALAVFARTQRHIPAATEASSMYNSLLKVTHEHIIQLGSRRLDKDFIDACLLTITLMSRYEGIANPSDRSTPLSLVTSLPIWPHHNGAIAVLKLWHDRCGHNDATSIIKQTRRGAITSSLLRHLRLPGWIQDGKAFGERGLELNYDRIFVRIVNLHYKVTQKQELPLATEMEQLNREASELDDALMDWAAQLPDSWSYHRQTLSQTVSWPSMDFYWPVIYTYSSLGYASVWSQYFSARMLINSVRSTVLRASLCFPEMDSTRHWQRMECLIRLISMANGLASTVPFCLERVKLMKDHDSRLRQSSIQINTDEAIRPYLANLVVWPLTIASALQGVESKQQLWFKAQLARLGRITGEGVLECAETEQCPRL